MPETGITRTLAEWSAGTSWEAIPREIQREAVRTFVNWLGCAVGGAGEETTRVALRALKTVSGPAQATVLGTGDRLDVLNAALVNGISSHVLDYDDTHLKTIIHPGGPVASAALAVAEWRGSSGRDLITAVALGVEACCRIGNSVYPDHYDRGWHITGTAGVFGAAVAAGRLLGLGPRPMTWALGIAASQASGLREMFGTMTKSFHPGRAAQGGILGSLLASEGFDSSLKALEAPRGFANVLSTKQDLDEVIGGLGERWEAGLNSYKPFACGIVIHPVIDGCLQLRERLGPSVGAIRSVRLRTHPLVLELTGKTGPGTGLEGKFSVFHAAAVALLRGDGSPTAFTDEAVNDPDVVELRSRVEVTVDPRIHEASAEIVLVLADGATFELGVERAIGSVERPLSDDQLEAKFLGQAARVIGSERASHLLQLAWQVPDLQEVSTLTTVAGPR